MPNNNTPVLSTFSRKYTKQRSKLQMKMQNNWQKELQEMSMVLTSMWRISPGMAMGLLSLRVLSSVMPLVAIYQTKQIIDAFSKGGVGFEHVVILTIQLGFALLMSAICQQTGDYVTSRFQQKVADHFSIQVIQKAGKVPYAYYENPDFHKTLHLAQQQALHRTSQLIPALNGALSSLISIILLCAFFIALQSYFFLVLLVFALPAAINKWMQAKKATDLEFKLVDKERESHYLFQLLTGFQFAKELRAYGFGGNFLQRFTTIRNKILWDKNRLQKQSLKKNMLAEGLEIVIFSAALLYLAKSTYNKEITVGFFIVYLQGIQRFQTVSTTFFQSFLQVFQLRVFFRDLFSFLHMDEKENVLPGAHGFPASLDQLTVSELQFSYPGKNTPAVQHFNLQAKKGQIIAIVGENGSGKSTLVKLLTGMYKAHAGDILFNDVSIQHVSNQALLKHSAIFFQDFERYFLKVSENIHFNLDSGDEYSAQINSAAEKSGADEFIHKLAYGYNTTLGNIFQSREQLSGGEWQKLALSRIFYRDAVFVVLDEPSSALDAISELKLYEHIKLHCKDKITILVSHRLYNLKIADYIYVMEHGRISEEGTFETLIKNKGVFQSLYEKQKI